jgi:chemotaxis protein methyltransferase CheR
MIPGEVREAQWLQLSNLIAERMGLHFPRERWDDLQRGLAGAAQEFGFADAGACVSWLMSAPRTQAQIEVLASHLTVGETYFYRDTKTLEALAQNILPDLIR